MQIVTEVCFMCRRLLTAHTPAQFMACEKSYRGLPCFENAPPEVLLPQAEAVYGGDGGLSEDEIAFLDATQAAEDALYAPLLEARRAEDPELFELEFSIVDLLDDDDDPYSEESQRRGAAEVEKRIAASEARERARGRRE